MSHSSCKLPVWLPALLLSITWVVDVQMAHARPFWTSTLQDLSNDIKSTPLRGVLAPTIELWIFPNFPLLWVWVSSSHISQSGVATIVILDKRLVEWAKQHGLHAKGQIGFHKYYRTTDQLFILWTLKEQGKAKKKSSYYCFVDLKGVQYYAAWSALASVG
jgi:hypothetical protein